MFNMSMIIVTLTSIIQLTPEQDLSYNEITNIDPATLKKIRNEATVVIQSGWRHFLSNGIESNAKFPKRDFKTRLRARLEFVSISKRYKYKRLNVSNANPQLANIINDLKVKVNGFLEKGMKNLNIYRTEITKQVGEMRQNQYKMDAKILKMYDVTMRMNSFLVACNRGEEVEGKKFNTTKNLYTHRRAKMPVNAVKEFLLLFDDARHPADKFYESYRPMEKATNPEDEKSDPRFELEEHLNRESNTQNNAPPVINALQIKEVTEIDKNDLTESNDSSLQGREMAGDEEGEEEFDEEGFEKNSIEEKEIDPVLKAELDDTQQNPGSHASKSSKKSKGSKISKGSKKSKRSNTSKALKAEKITKKIK